MKRRQFITLLGGAAAAWPLAARAQQAERVRKVGVLINSTATPEQRANLAAFQQTLQQLGWTVGHNVQMDIRWADGDARETRRHAGELVGSHRTSRAWRSFEMPPSHPGSVNSP
jgi:putative ABC transport system substrate-binding protein